MERVSAFDPMLGYGLLRCQHMVSAPTVQTEFTTALRLVVEVEQEATEETEA